MFNIKRLLNIFNKSKEESQYEYSVPFPVRTGFTYVTYYQWARDKKTGRCELAIVTGNDTSTIVNSDGVNYLPPPPVEMFTELVVDSHINTLLRSDDNDSDEPEPFYP